MTTQNWEDLVVAYQNRTTGCLFPKRGSLQTYILAENFLFFNIFFPEVRYCSSMFSMKVLRTLYKATCTQQTKSLLGFFLGLCGSCSFPGSCSRSSSCFPRSCGVVPLVLVVPVALVISEGLVAHDVLNVPVVLVVSLVLVQRFLWF